MHPMLVLQEAIVDSLSRALGDTVAPEAVTAMVRRAIGDGVDRLDVVHPLFYEYDPEPPGPKDPGDCGVYFIRSGSFIKIGLSKRVRSRASSIATASPQGMEVLAILPCPVDALPYVESRLHARFAELRVRGEWFRDQPVLLEFIEEVRADGTDAFSKFWPEYADRPPHGDTP